jgi:hypothetical protein
MRLAADTKTCSRCKAEKNLDAFSTNRAMNDGKNIYCRACCSALDFLVEFFAPDATRCWGLRPTASMCFQVPGFIC